MIWNCKDFRKDLMNKKDGQIKDELKLSLEELTRLSGHDEIKTAWEDLKKVVASVISIQKIKKYRTLISKYGVDWYREYYENKEDNGKVNPVRLIADVWSNSDKIGFDCDKKNGEWKSYFDECGREAKVSGSGNAKVVRVLKPTAEREDNRKWNYYVPIKSGSTSWVSNEKLRSDLESKYSRNIYSTGKLGELVVETCDHKISWIYWGQDSFCKEILQKFFGANVSDKRYCLYEMPDTEGFLNKNKK